MPWEFVVTNASGVALGTLDKSAYDRSVRIPINASRTCSYRVRHDHPLADALLTAPDVLTKVYDDDKRLHFVGPVVTAEETSGSPGGASIAVTCADAGWRLGKRLIGKADAGFVMGSALLPVSLGSIGKAIVDAVNADGESGVEVGDWATTGQGFAAGWLWKPALEAIGELSGTLDGFDWLIEPIEPAAGKFGRIHFYDALGQFRPTAVFEYGTGKHNVGSYKRAVNADAIANRVYAVPPSGAEGVVQVAENAPSIAQHGVYEDVASNDLAPDAMRLQLAQEHVEVRRNGRQTIEFTPTALGGPDEGTDFEVGDIVTFRAKVGDEPRIDALFRIFSIQYDIDAEGLAARTVTVSA